VKSIKIKLKMKKHIIILFAVFASTILISNSLEGMSTDLINKVNSTLTGENKNDRIILDASGVPIVNYGYVEGVYIGEKRSPVAVSQKAMSYYENYEEGNQSQKQLFLNCADWLVNNSTPNGNYTILEYKFPWPLYNMTSPWRSGMAQGIALHVLIRAHNITGDDKYLVSAKKLLNSFFYEVDEGGVTYKSSNDGWWYEEYADEGGKVSRVLNGMMFAMLGIYDYYNYTGDPDAKYLFDQGVIALKKNLPVYDDDGYSYYDILGRPAAKYHKIHIALLESLYDITHEEIFKTYHDRWASYREPIFIVRLMQEPLTKMEIAIFVSNFVAILILLEIIVFAIERTRKHESNSKQQRI